MLYVNVLQIKPGVAVDKRYVERNLEGLRVASLQNGIARYCEDWPSNIANTIPVYFFGQSLEVFEEFDVAFDGADVRLPLASHPQGSSSLSNEKRSPLCRTVRLASLVSKDSATEKNMTIHFLYCHPGVLNRGSESSLNSSMIDGSKTPNENAAIAESFRILGE